MLKRVFDFSFALVLFGMLFWALIVIWILSAIATKSNGLFLQKRIGQYGKPFTIIKFKTMRLVSVSDTKNEVVIPTIAAFFSQI
ncbi:MAG: hypothetical protein E2604_16835 [Flavobacterium sp.]|nr:hypothetical protein [Flavobacterium sp.]